ncbi:Hypothetical_protein [Hexamita inflata]|uniref:Hypothetical_protein n=1 Tax=Hexamita inflata TaxID=28002 RepID=A0AA86N6P3_9EUKA|nr:Hypothetical protein HINF_LOCUS1522 [Hexamita inflata]
MKGEIHENQAFQIPLDPNQQILQIVFTLVEIIIYTLAYTFWLHKFKYETKMTKLITTIYFVSRILGHLINEICILIAYSLTVMNKQNIEVIRVINEVCSGAFFIICKTIPNYCIILKLLMSLSIFLCPLKINLSLQIAVIILVGALIAQIVCQSVIKNSLVTTISDYVTFGFTIVCTIGQSILLVLKLGKSQSFLFQEQKLQHAKTLYAAVLYSIALVSIEISNTIQIAYGYKNLESQWFYWALQDGYLLVVAAAFCFAAFPPQYLILKYSNDVQDDEILSNEMNWDDVSD